MLECTVGLCYRPRKGLTAHVLYGWIEYFLTRVSSNLRRSLAHAKEAQSTFTNSPECQPNRVSPIMQTCVSQMFVDDSETVYTSNTSNSMAAWHAAMQAITQVYALSILEMYVYTAHAPDNASVETQIL